MKTRKRLTKAPLDEMERVMSTESGRDRDYIARRISVARRERELQCAHMCAFDATRVQPDLITHLDCNVLRIWPDVGVSELIKFFTYKSELMRGFAATCWVVGDRRGAHHFRLEASSYEQALIKLERERDRRMRVYNQSCGG